MGSNKLCMSCMNAVPDDAARCPTCGYNGSQRNPEICLPIGFRLSGRYVIGKMKDADGDSISYIAYDTSMSKKVEVREFLPVNGCSRNFDTFEVIPKQGAELHYKTALVDFCELFKNLQKLSHIAAIITTTDFFEANQTAYAVLDIFDGITLRELLTLKGGEFDYAQCLTLVNPLIDAVSAIHAVNLIHRGISPDTIYVNRNGDIKLSGFATSSVRTKGTEVASKLFSGYSAPEQYTTSMFQSQATDVYAVAATLYRCLTGATPQDAEQRRSYDTLEAPDKLRTNIPRFISNAVMHALLVNSKERTQTMLEFKKLLNDEHSKLAPVIPAETDEYNSDEYREETTAEAEKRAPIKDKKYFIARLAAIISASFLVVMAVVFIVSNVLGSKKEPISEKPVATDSFKVPSFVGKTLDELKYDTINFKIEIQPTYDPDAKDNEVVSQSPQANTTAKKGASITIYYNHEIIIDSMIDLKGLYVMNAEQLLKSRGIKYTAQEKATSSYPPGTVFEQSVEPGKKFNVNEDKLTIYIAKKSG